VAGTFKDKGLVIKEYAAGESDKRLLLLLFDKGRVMAFARGAGNPKSKFHASAQVFAFSEFVFYEGTGFLSVTQCGLIENFYGVRRDFERLCLASHVIEMAERILMPEVLCKNELRLIYLTLQKLSAADYPPMLAAVAFELKFLQMAGFCDKTLPDIKLSKAAAGAVSWVLESDIKSIFSFKAANHVISELFTAMDYFRRGILDTPPKSLELLQ
jgi:DNA repair protein RecO